MQQFWFVGAHSDVGGGNLKDSLSEITLQWMQDKADLDGMGLEIDVSLIPATNDDYITEKVSDSYVDFLGGWYRLLRRLTFRGRHYRPIKRTANGHESVHPTAEVKIAQDASYKFRNLAGPGTHGSGEPLPR